MIGVVRETSKVALESRSKNEGIFFNYGACWKACFTSEPPRKHNPSGVGYTTSSSVTFTGNFLYSPDNRICAIHRLNS